MLPLTPTGTAGALVVRAPVIIAALREYFELLWERATPLKASRSAAPGDRLTPARAWTGYAILSRRLEVPPGPITVVTQLQSQPFGTCAGTISGSCACGWPGLACEGRGPEPLPSGDRCEIGNRGVDGDGAAKRELAACAGQLHVRWKEAAW